MVCIKHRLITARLVIGKKKCGSVAQACAAFNGASAVGCSRLAVSFRVTTVQGNGLECAKAKLAPRFWRRDAQRLLHWQWMVPH